MYRSGLVVVFEIPDQIIEHAACIILVTAVIVLISGGPHHNCRAVFQTLKCGDGTVHGQILEVCLCTSVVHQRMGLQVCLCHHIQTIFVTQVIQVLVVAVVGGTDRVQVVLLHDRNVLFLCLMRYIFAVYRVCVMAVCSL